MPFATGHRGARVFYDVHGDRGPHVVLIQGLGLSSTFWFDLPRRLAEHPEDGFRVVVLDNRGVGRSDKPRGPYRMAHMADDVSAVLDHAGIDGAYVVGISMGGMIAQHVALRHAARVRGLVLLATTCGLPHGHLPGPRTLATLLSLPFVRRGPTGGLPHLLLPRRHVPRAAELLADWPAAMRREPVPPSAFFAQFAAVLAHSTGARLGEIRCPTVVVTGTEDILVPPRNAEVLAKRIRGAMLEVLPDVGHGIPILDEAVVHRALSRLRRAA